MPNVTIAEERELKAVAERRAEVVKDLISLIRLAAWRWVRGKLRLNKCLTSSTARGEVLVNTQ